MPANASAMAAPASGSGVLSVRAFDAVTTAAERDGWKHLALIGEEYAIFNDRGLFEGPALIRNKWPFLPEHFKANIDSASVVLENRAWKYMFVKGTERIIFFDWGIVVGPQNYNTVWPFLDTALRTRLEAVTAHLENGQWVHLATFGEVFASFTDRGVINSGLIRTTAPFLPARFHSNLEDASMELENGRRKISFYKGGERIVFFDGGPVVEIANVVQKWPFLASWVRFV
jgi:hypothetical protein